MNIIQQLSSRSINGRFGKSFEQSFHLHLHKKEFSDTVQVIRNSDVHIADSIWSPDLHTLYCVDVGSEVQIQSQFCRSCGNYTMSGIYMTNGETGGSTQCNFNCQ
jgi:hypothetical protein